MIIARLRVEEHDGRRTLVGRITSNWPLAVGTLVVLKRRGDDYELMEVGERVCRPPDGQNELSFYLEDTDGTTV
jgi:hypothetical protein